MAKPGRVTAEHRFLIKIDKREDGCWHWLGEPMNTGYGQFWTGTGRKSAHRYAYEYFVGPIPAGLHLDHLCKNRMCVNPSHLEAVTPLENALRSDSPPAKNARKTHCISGHELSGDNLYVAGTGKRQCRTCRRAAKRRHDQKVAALAA